MKGIPRGDHYRAYRAQREAHWDIQADASCHLRVNAAYRQLVKQLYQRIIPAGQSILEIGCGKGDLLASLSPARGVGVDFSQQMVVCATKNYPALEFIQGDAQDLSTLVGPFDYILFSDLLDDLWDVQSFLEHVGSLCCPSTRVIFNFYSHLWSLPLRMAQKVGLATPLLPQNWLTVEDIRGLLQLTGFEVINHHPEILLPLPIPVISSFCNRVLVKFPPFSCFNLTHMFVARYVEPPQLHDESAPKVSVIVPARNEEGNIAQLIEQLPLMGSGTEVIFVEGGSSDKTYGTIEAEIRRRPDLTCFVYRQYGAGKGDAVRLGFERASGDILMILDADLTVSPQDLPKFYHALVAGRGEFVNGVRLVYPMHEKAMRLFNLIGNKFFSLTFSWLLGQPIKDTLCGTKVLWKRDYEKIASNRGYFGDFDPFGDFDLLFGAARLNLKILDLPVRYGERTYGTTNIHRWSHGWLLLRMLLFAAKKLKFR